LIWPLNIEKAGQQSKTPRPVVVVCQVVQERLRHGGIDVIAAHASAGGMPAAKMEALLLLADVVK
jgi:hypothetical protein